MPPRVVSEASSYSKRSEHRYLYSLDTLKFQLFLLNDVTCIEPLTYNGTTWLLTRLTRAKNLVASKYSHEECIDHIHHLHGGSKAWVNILCNTRINSYKNVVRWDGIGNTWSSTNSAQVAPRPLYSSCLCGTRPSEVVWPVWLRPHHSLRC